MRILQIATVGEDVEPIMIGVREYPVSKLVLLHTKEFEGTSREIAKTLAPLRLDVESRDVEGDIMLDVLRIVSSIAAENRLLYDDIYINVAAGTRMTGCAATAAAFVNGIKAFGVAGDRCFMLPVLKFSYHELISDAKLAILRAIEDAGGNVESLQVLSDVSGIDKSLLSYHLRGGRESRGLEDLGLVEIDRGTRGRLAIGLTPMAQLLIGGYPADLPSAKALN